MPELMFRIRRLRRSRFIHAIALVFIGARFVLGVTGWEALGVEIVQAVIWSCVALSVPLADVAIHWKELRSVVAVPVETGVRRANAPRCDGSC